VTEPTFCVCDRHKGLVCAYHSGDADPESRFRRPTSATDILAFAVIWFSVFGVLMTAIWLYAG